MIDEKSLKYAPTHEWVQIDGDTATIGLSRFAVDQLTDLIVIDLPEVGQTLEAGKSFGEIESVKAVSDLYAPVGGEVVEVNPAVASDVQVIAEDPYSKGWLVKVKPGPGADLSGLLDYETYQKKVADSAH